VTTVAAGGAAVPPSRSPGPGETVARVLAVLPQASTSPALVETGDGARWVLKFSGAGPGPFGLLTEYLALGIAAAFAAPVPAARPLFLPEGFPWMVGTDEFDAMLQRSAGWNLGIAYIEGARPAVPEDLVPGPGLAAIAASDGFLHNVDRTARNPNLLVAAGTLRAIDYDACLYLSRALGPERPASTALPSGHLLADCALPAVAPPAIDFAAMLGPVPEDWLAAARVGRPSLAERLSARYAAWVAARRSPLQPPLHRDAREGIVGPTPGEGEPGERDPR